MVSFSFFRIRIKSYSLIANALLLFLIVQGCVSKKVYMYSVQKAGQLTQQNQFLRDSLIHTKTDFVVLMDSLTAKQVYYDAIMANLREDATMAKKEVDNTKKEIALTQLKLQEKTTLVQTLQQGYSVQSKKLQEAYAKQQVLEDFLQVQAQQWKKLEEPIREVFKGIPDSSFNITHEGGRLMISLQNRLLFPSGSTSLNKEGQDKISVLAKALSNYPDLTLTVEGHTDNVPVLPNQPFKDNLDLSLQRARVVSNIMKSSIASEKLIVAGRGEFSPMASNDTEEGKAINRRTEIIVTRENQDFDAFVNQLMLAPPPTPTRAKIITNPETIEKYFIDDKSWSDFKFSNYRGKNLVELIRLLDRNSNWKINTGNNPFSTIVRRHHAVVVYSVENPLVQPIVLYKDDTTHNKLIILQQ